MSHLAHVHQRHTNLRTYIVFHTYTHTYIPTHIPTYTPTYTPRYTPTYIPTHMPTYTPTCTQKLCIYPAQPASRSLTGKTNNYCNAWLPSPTVDRCFALLGLVSTVLLMVGRHFEKVYKHHNLQDRVWDIPHC